MRIENNYNQVFDAQQQFRLVLDSIARPGKINALPVMDVLPPVGINQASVLVGFIILNADVSFIVSGDNNEEKEAYISLNTNSRTAKLDAADYIFISGQDNGDRLSEVKVGTLSYPEDSATLIIDVTVISESYHENALKINLKGPGVNGEKDVYVSGLNAAILANVKEINLEFPLGIDLIITDKQNRILCIPRSNRFTFNNQVNNKQNSLAE